MFIVAVQTMIIKPYIVINFLFRFFSEQIFSPGVKIFYLYKVIKNR